ncbi:DNA polymerase I [Caldimonas thermodepolymerans]|uniref:DNA polymerase I n=1 Tax=Caldimonas thermodepolymerans TaxID=215580 RepID=A0A2S5T8X2_9BURK|nr:DNA polymerase [Caldimonas thermodepolymerans]PPE71464.1 DNA polymerase I [Caldimonas thermodepolymerans]QPC30493.1 DNA polymerase I [Caldimonas thermodepolymerans]RDI02923.1 DNA polymerase-1 [Caldimonas thermodepolymerans]
MTDDGILLFDIEGDGLLDTLTTCWVLCISGPDAATVEDVDAYTDHDPAFPAIRVGIDRLKRHVEEGGKVVAHNGIGYDAQALEKLYGLVLKPWDHLLDTLVLGRLHNPSRPGGHSLGSYGAEFGVPKGEHDEWDRYSRKMLDYCRQDVVVLAALWRKLKGVMTWGESPELEHRVAHLIELQRANGFRLDLPKAIQRAAELDDECQRLRLKLSEVFPPIYVSTGTRVPKRNLNTKPKDGSVAMSYTAGAPYTAIKLQDFNPDSEFHVARRLKAKYGWEAPLTEKGNPNITEAVLKKLDFPEVSLLLEYFRKNKMWTQLAAPPKGSSKGGWIQHANERTHRVHGYVNSNGAVTGRMTHSNPNSANIDKELRDLWIPGEGFLQVGTDAEGLELRMLAHYLYPYDGGALTRALLEGDKSKGTDAHSMNRKNTDLFSRDGAKTLLYGSLYGAGDEKAGAIWVADWRSSGKPESEWPAWALNSRGKLKPLKAIGKEVKRRLIDGIAGFGQLIEDVQAAAKKRGWLRGLDGRRIRVRSQHAALNTLLQGGGAVVMKKALELYHRRVTEEFGWVHGKHFGYLANVHDEVQQEVLPELAETAGKEFALAITRAGEHFNLKCRLDGAYDIGTNWHETH